MRARWYDPNSLRFLSRDPLLGDASDPADLNSYSYAGSNPLTVFDPTGMALKVDDSGACDETCEDSGNQNPTLGCQEILKCHVIDDRKAVVNPDEDEVDVGSRACGLPPLIQICGNSFAKKKGAGRPATSVKRLPDFLPGFPGAVRTKSTQYTSAGKLRKEWTLPNGFKHLEDTRHGLVEMYDRVGKHLGQFDWVDGHQVSPPNPRYNLKP